MTIPARNWIYLVFFLKSSRLFVNTVRILCNFLNVLKYLIITSCDKPCHSRFTYSGGTGCQQMVYIALPLTKHLVSIRGVFGKYVDKFNRMRIKYTRQMKFRINEYQILNSKYDQYENLTLINDLDISH